MLDAMAGYESEELSVMLCRMLYLSYTRFKNGMDQTLREQGLTMEQYLVLVNIRYNNAPMRITDLAHWLERSTNSMSMLVDRMVKAGLLRRVRDKRDRRVVNVFLTGKAETALEQAGPASWEFNQLAMSSLSDEDKRTLANLCKMVNCNILEHLSPGTDVEGIIEHDFTRRDHVMKGWHKQVQLATPKAKRSSSKKGKPQAPAEEQ
jgi:DNA-binding MarR family transcriptional regulator